MLLIIGIICLTLIIIIAIIVVGLVIYNRYSSNNSETNSNNNNTNISPLQLTDDSRNEYSVKLIHRKTGLNTIYSGHFLEDFSSKSICLQQIFMKLIEMTIQELIAPNFNIGLLPNLGRPFNVILKPKDILVSFIDRGDYLIFGEDLSVSFYSAEEPVQIHEHITDGIEFNFVSSYYNISYSGVYDTYGEFILNMNNGDNSVLTTTNLTFNNTSVPKQTLSNDTVLYKGTKIYVTILPEVLPNSITVAGFVPGIFVSNSFTTFSTYIHNQYSFTTSEDAKLTPLLNALYYPMQYSLKYGIDLMDRYTHSSDNGFYNISYSNDTILEIRLS